jgi:integrase
LKVLSVKVPELSVVPTPFSKKQPPPYDRPTAVTAPAAGRGVHPKIVSDLLGHSTVAITLDLYSHVTPTMQREAASVMDDLLSQ